MLSFFLSFCQSETGREAVVVGEGPETKRNAAETQQKNRQRQREEARNRQKQKQNERQSGKRCDRGQGATVGGVKRVKRL